MGKNVRIGAVLLTLSLFFLAACAALQSGYEFPTKHPSEADLGQKPMVCTECHAEPSVYINYARFNHTAYFADNHRHEAYQQEQVCAMCHQTSFCNDCHATPIELKPSIKDQTGNYRRYPHRGDYLSRHRIDGRVDPTSCFRCHGNPRTALSCNTAGCHG